MKKVVCGSFGNIYYATILKDGVMSSSGRVNVTDDAIRAVTQHLISNPEYKKNNGYYGYIFHTNEDDRPIEICAFDSTKYTITEAVPEEKEIEFGRVDTDSDVEFLTGVVKEICDYAKKNKMSQNDTLKTVADDIYALLEIATFNVNTGGEKENG